MLYNMIIEILALGIPVVTTKEAVHGMRLIENKGIFFANNVESYVQYAIKLLTDKTFLKENQILSRNEIKMKWDHQLTYEKFSNDLSLWLDAK